MAHRSSWEVVLKKIPEDYYEYGFWGALELNLGLSEQEFYDEFNQLMRSSIGKKLIPRSHQMDGISLITALKILLTLRI